MTHQPHASPAPATGTIDNPLSVLIVGAGPGGIATAVLLQQRGIDDVVVLEQSAGLGGTWFNNRYPGLECDVISDHYSFSFFQDYRWARNYARPPEIVRYLQAVVDRFGLGGRITTNCRVESATWLDAERVWRVVDGTETERHARFLVGAVGMFNEVVRPDIAGLVDFAGPVVHTAEWPADDRALLDGKRVAVIGSAASALQVVPTIAAAVALLEQYQRTPNWVFPKEEIEFTEQEILDRLADLDGRARSRSRSFDLLRDFNDFNNEPLMAELGQQALANLEAVQDPQLRAALTPVLPLGSQRPLQSSDYYAALNRDNVTLVTSAIETVTTDAIVTADGVRHPTDAIVLATGYAAHKFFSVVDVVGAGEVSLRELWADGAYAYKGIVVEHFPNMFMLYGPNTNGGSIIDKLEIQARYITAKIALAAERGLTRLEITAGAVAGYNDELQDGINKVDAWQSTGSRYYRAPAGRVVTQCPYTVSEYEALTLQDDLDDYLTDDAAPSLLVSAEER